MRTQDPTLETPDAILSRVVQYLLLQGAIHLRQVIIILIVAGLIAYDLFLLNGQYTRVVMSEASSIWNAIESFVRSWL